MKTKILFTVLTIMLCCTLTYAQPGSIDVTFNPGTGANNAVSTTSIQSDGKIIICGRFTSYNGTARNYIARLNADGSLDNSFNPGTGANGNVGSSPIRFTAIQSDGKIIIGGDFTSYNGTARNDIARLNTDGSLDTSFDPGTGANGNVFLFPSISSTAIQSDGKIVIGGHFDSFNGTARKNIARLNTDGSLDTSFDPGTGADNIVITTSIQSDGKIIIGGYFDSFNGTARNRIARLNTDGSIDSSFNPGTGVNDSINNYPYINTNSIQSDGKIIIGGWFSSINGTARKNIARLNTDGSLDTSFDPGTGANNGVGAISIQSDGKIIIGGSFNSYNGTARNRIARLNTDGSLDTYFDPGTGANNVVFTTAIQSDGKVIISGSFTSYNGTARNRIARLHECHVTYSLQLQTVCNSNSYVWNGNTYTATGIYMDTIPNASGCDSIMTLNLTINNVDVSVTQNGANLTAGADSATYQWVDCNNNYAIIPGETNKNFTATVNGNYAVVITQNNCTDTSSCYAINNINTQTPIVESSFQLYPNPFSTQATLQSDHIIYDGTLTIYNNLGEVVTQITNINGQSVSINRGNLANGLYFIRLTEGKHELMMKKVIVVD